jgi:hypothetical protein
MSNLSQGSAREKIDASEFARLKAIGAIILNEGRNRPFYFDGRFLTAADLTRDQLYVLSRQADLAKARGVGIVQGLIVSRGGAATSILIYSGYGITPSGELVILAKNQTVALSDLATVQRLDANFGLGEIPSEPARTASGLFVVALRPVEYTADPIASYPTSIAGTRQSQDGSIIEATAITLIPYPDGGGGNFQQRRSQIAKEIFVDDTMRGLPTNALPLAMVALDRGIVQWVDNFMVRRELGAEATSILSLGAASRALREAQVQQYQKHLAEIIKERQARGSLRFAATEHFRALPPVGQMPIASLELVGNEITQLYFPPEVDVELSFVPSDEIAAIVEDSLLLPPIDLTLRAEERDSIAILVLIAVTREEILQLSKTLPSIQRELKAAAPGQLAKRLPMEVFKGLRINYASSTPDTTPDTTTNNLQTWQQQWQKANEGLLWYVRRRRLAYRDDVMGYSLKLGSNATPNPVTPTPVTPSDIQAAVKNLYDGFSKVVAQAASRSAYLSSSQLDALNAFASDGDKRLDVVYRITRSASIIITNASRSLFAEQPALSANIGGYIRTLEIILRYVTYAIYAGDSSILDDRALNGLRETNLALNLTGASVAFGIQKVKEAAIAVASDPNGIIRGDYDSLVAELSSYFDRAAAAAV